MLSMGKTIFSSSTEAYFNHAVITARNLIDGKIDDSLFFRRLRTRRCYRALWLTPPYYRCPLHVMPDSERMRISSASWQRLSMSSGSNGLRWGAISQQAGRVFSHRPLSSPPPTLVPLLPRSSYELTVLWHAPHPSRICPSASVALKSVDDTEGKRIWAPASSGWVCGRTSLPPHSYQMEGEGEAIRPSCAEPHLHSLDTLTRRLQRFTQWLCSRSSRPRCSPMRKLVWIQPLSGTWGARQTWLYAPPPKPSFDVQPYSVGAPSLAHNDGDERGDATLKRTISSSASSRPDLRWLSRQLNQH